MKFIQTIFLALFSLVAMAQSTDRNSLGFYFASAYPEVPIKIVPRTYCVLVDGASRGFWDFSLNVPMKTTFTSTSAPSGANVLVEFTNIVSDAPIDIVGNDPQKTVKEKDDALVIHGKKGSTFRIPGTGTSTTTTTYTKGRYKAVSTVTYSFDMTISVDNQVVHQETFAESRSFESPWYENPNQAQDSLKAIMRPYTMKPLVGKANNVARLVLGATYLSPDAKCVAYGATASKKTGYDYTEINDAVAKMEKGFDFIKNDDWNVEDFKDMCEGCVEVWEKELKQANMNDKKARINAEIACGLNYDIALYYFFTKDFAKAKDYFKAVFAIDPKFAKCKYYKDMMPKYQIAKEKYEAMMQGQQ